MFMFLTIKKHTGKSYEIKSKCEARQLNAAMERPLVSCREEESVQHFNLILFNNIFFFKRNVLLERQTEKEEGRERKWKQRKREREIPSPGFLPKCLYQPGLSLVHVKNQGLNPGLPCG